MPANRAAWIPRPKAHQLEVKPAPYTKAQENEIVVKNGAVAINPIDWILQDVGSALSFPWLKYPAIFGSDVAGEVVDVGPEVSHIKVGDRVMGHAIGQDKLVNQMPQRGFQEYTVLKANMTSQIPGGMSYESACVMPLGLSTAACGLFQKDQLGLQLPTSTTTAGSAGKTLLVWGGSTSVGCNAIQLAVAAGYEVFTTCSPRNFGLVKTLGASQAFDYSSPTVVAEVIRAFEGKTTAGALSMGAGAADACMDVLHGCVKGNKFVSMATYPLPTPLPKSFVILRSMYAFITWSLMNFIRSKVRGLGYKFIFATSLAYNNVGKAIYNDFLPKALANGTYKAAPEPLVYGKGLECIQGAMDVQKKGVSAKKVVVSL